jgi:7,8-dihydro-6-hydroxymethylpterin-pyrophosphokinase
MWECGKEATFQCPFCPQRCKRRSHQLRHMRRAHREFVMEPLVELGRELFDAKCDSDLSFDSKLE